MTKPYRQEMIDAHMLDSNWKKYLNMGMVFVSHQSTLMFMSHFAANSLKRKYAKALLAQQQSSDVFQELDQSIDPALRKKWEAQEAMAMEYRGDYLKIYDVKSEMGESNVLAICAK